MKKESILEDMVISENDFIVIRCDGRRFGKLIEQAGFKVPYDKGFRERMVKVAKRTLENLFNAGMAYVFSDEISFVLPKSFTLYNRRVEKLLSITAGFVSSEASLEFYELDMSPASFDAKIFSYASMNDVLEYLDERKNSCFRNFVFTTLRDYLKCEGKSSTQIAKDTNGMSTRSQIEFLLKNKVDVYRLQFWKREGDLIYFEPYEKTVKRGPFGARKILVVGRRRIKTRKPFRFNAADKRAVADIINSVYVEEINGERT